MKLLSLLGLLSLLLTLGGCSRRSLTPSELADFFQGVSVGELHSLDYVFDGNFAGYTFVARLHAPEPVIRRILQGSFPLTEDFLRSEPDLLKHSRQQSFLTLLGPESHLPPWLDLPWTETLHARQKRSSNHLSSTVHTTYYYDPSRQILYIAEGGI